MADFRTYAMEKTLVSLNVGTSFDVQQRIFKNMHLLLEYLW